MLKLDLDRSRGIQSIAEKKIDAAAVVDAETAVVEVLEGAIPAATKIRALSGKVVGARGAAGQ